MNQLPRRSVMMQAFFDGDASFDGVFYVGVRTTGIFCRPSCRARKPKREHVEFFAAARDALISGYRPCLRCHPLDLGETHPDWATELLTLLEQAPTTRIKEGDLRQMGLDPNRVRRYFKRRFGMTFQAFSRAARLSAGLTQIKNGGAIDDAVFDQGFESHSGFREAFSKWFGGPPGAAQGGEFILLSWIESPLGPMVAGATSKGACLLEFTDRRMLETQMKILKRRFALPMAPGRNAHLEQLDAELNEYFRGDRRAFSVPVEAPGTPFENRVWQMLTTIPYGETRSYGDIARALGQPGAVRAVGSANGRNRIAIVIPCHRVVNADGRLGGYGGGLWRKKRLLDLEREQNS